MAMSTSWEKCIYTLYGADSVFFGTTTFMANLMLSHHSLEKVVEEKAREDETCHYKFNTMIPKAVLTDHLAIQIAWILEHDQVHKEWGD